MAQGRLRSRKLAWGAAATILAGCSIWAVVTMIGSSSGPITPGPSVTRRLTAEQYQNIIHDLFGSDIDLGGRIEPDLRVNGLLAVGASHVSITAAGMEQYDAMARAVAAQALDEQHRDMLLPCQPASASEVDEECARAFLSKVGRLIYRRALTDTQLQAYVAAAAEATRLTHSFHEGLALSLSGMLSSPSFLFREEVLEPDPQQPEIGRAHV
jgi:hypothetical protein